MKKTLRNHLLLTMLMAFIGLNSSLLAQTVFWSDTFEAPAGGAGNNNAGAGWTINQGGFGTNQWFLNLPSSCGTGTGIQVSCDGFICNIFGGPSNPVYNASVGSDRSAVSPVISTVGRSNMTFSFAFVCLGVPNLDYGTLSFSGDGGTTWNELPARYQGVSSCSTVVIPVPAQYENIPNFRIRFRWINAVNSPNASDPAFSIDNLSLLATSQSCTPPTVNAGSAVSICAGAQTTIGGSPTATGGSPANYTYSWAPATGLSSATVANPVATPSSTTTYTVTVSGGDANCVATSQVTVTVNQPPVVTTTPAGNVSICAGQSQTLTAAAGFSNYVWTTPSGTVNGQTVTANQAGSYTVSATQNGCNGVSAPVVITVNQPAVLSTTPSGNVSICTGQSQTLTAATGFSNYVWTTPSGPVNGQTVTANQAGPYTVSATQNGCDVESAPVVVTVSSTQTLNVNADGPLSLCPGQDVVLTAEAGFSNYLWSNGESGQSITVESAGTFTVTAQGSSGCDAESQPQVVTISPPFSVSITPSGNLSLCQGETITLTAQAGFSDYVWSNNTPGQTLTVSAAGGYSVSAVNASGCTGVSSVVNVTVDNAPVASFSYDQLDEEEYNVQFSFTGANADSYFWDFGLGTSTQEDPIFGFGFDNDWPVTLIVSNDCGSDTITQIVEVIKTGISNLPGVAFNIFPNPASDILVLQGEALMADRVELSILSMSGALLMTQSLNLQGQFNQVIDVSGLASGLYLLQLQNGQGRSTLLWSKQ